MQTTMEGRDLYLRYTSPAGQSHIQQHRVWDAERFFAEQTGQYGPGPKQRQEDVRTVALATREEYLAQIKRRQ